MASAFQMLIPSRWKFRMCPWPVAIILNFGYLLESPKEVLKVLEPGSHPPHSPDTI